MEEIPKSVAEAPHVSHPLPFPLGQTGLFETHSKREEHISSDETVRANPICLYKRRKASTRYKRIMDWLWQKGCRGKSAKRSPFPQPLSTPWNSLTPELPLYLTILSTLDSHSDHDLNHHEYFMRSSFTHHCSRLGGCTFWLCSCVGVNRVVANVIWKKTHLASLSFVHLWLLYTLYTLYTWTILLYFRLNY